MGAATVRVVKVVELLKRVLTNIHISIEMVELQFEEIFVPLYEGLKEVICINMHLALKASFSFSTEKLSTSPGY